MKKTSVLCASVNFSEKTLRVNLLIPLVGKLKLNGAGGVRTPYLLRAKQAFSQLNYGPLSTSKL
jgi:hypothetical protein